MEAQEEEAAAAALVVTVASVVAVALRVARVASAVVRLSWERQELLVVVMPIRHLALAELALFFSFGPKGTNHETCTNRK